MAFEIENGVLVNYNPEPGETEIIIPDGVTKIGDRAFFYKSGIIQVTLPKCVSRIGNQAFYHCDSLTEVILPESVTYIDPEAFKACINLRTVLLPDDITFIGDEAFMNCYNLKQIAIPDNVTYLGQCAFRNCQKLLNVTLSNKLTCIKNGTFLNCESLSEVKLHDGITIIEWYSFAGCYSLSGLELPRSIKQIYNNAFTDIGLKRRNAGGIIEVIVPVELKPLLKGTGLLGKEGIHINFISSASKSNPTKKKTQHVELRTDAESIAAWAENQKNFELMQKAFPAVKMPKTMLINKKPAPVEALQFIAYSYFKCVKDMPAVNKANHRTAVGSASFVPDADKLAELLDRDSLCKALSFLAFDEVFYVDDGRIKAPFREKENGQERELPFSEWSDYLMEQGFNEVEDPFWDSSVQALCRYGDEKIIDRVCKWINHFLMYDIFEQKGRKNAIIGRTALLLSDTRRAAMYLDKCGALGSYAQMRNKTEAEIRDGFASALRFDTDGSLSLNDEE